MAFYTLKNIPKMTLLFLILACFMQLCFCAVHKVGDSAGWTTIGNVDYKLWAATKTFQVGDVIGMYYPLPFYSLMFKNMIFFSCFQNYW